MYISVPICILGLLFLSPESQSCFCGQRLSSSTPVCSYMACHQLSQANSSLGAMHILRIHSYLLSLSHICLNANHGWKICDTCDTNMCLRSKVACLVTNQVKQSMYHMIHPSFKHINMHYKYKYTYPIIRSALHMPKNSFA